MRPIPPSFPPPVEALHTHFLSSSENVVFTPSILCSTVCKSVPHVESAQAMTTPRVSQGRGFIHPRSGSFMEYLRIDSRQNYCLGLHGTCLMHSPHTRPWRPPC